MLMKYLVTVKGLNSILIFFNAQNKIINQSAPFPHITMREWDAKADLMYHVGIKKNQRLVLLVTIRFIYRSGR